MQTVISDQPYVFTPPRDSHFWPWFVALWLKHYLRRCWGLEHIEIRGLESLQASLAAGYGILLTPNHCRMSDPMALGMVCKALNQPFYMMASAHAFRGSALQTWLLPRLGAFSINREGTDREALRTAVDILAHARRPLVIFPEGVITRTNDRLINLQEGVAFIARSAAKQRAAQSPPGQVVVHPVGLRYRFKGDAEVSLGPVLERLERRLSWQPRRGEPLFDRIVRLGHALLALKEVEYDGRAREGQMEERLSALLQGVLGPLEAEWLPGREPEADVVQRVKALRKAILPGLRSDILDEAERNRRWRQLFDLEVAQQMFHFPPDYLGPNPSIDRLVETVERYEEAFGEAEPTVHRPMHLTISIGEAIPVDPARDKRAASDPLMDSLRASLETLLELTPPPAMAASDSVAAAQP